MSGAPSLTRVVMTISPHSPSGSGSPVAGSAEARLHAVAHPLAPALGADDSLGECDLVAHAALLYLLGEQQRVARRGTDNRCLEVNHELELLLGVAGAHGHDHGAELLGARLKSDAGRPEAVARGDLDAVV